MVAAGKGTRLKSSGDVKPLVELHGVPLIEHAMAAGVRAGVTRFVVVTGYEAPQLETRLQEIKKQHRWEIVTIRNPDFEKANGLSVLRGEQLLCDEFYLAMCDHLVDSAIYHRLADASLPKGAIALAVDRRMENPDIDIDDVTKVNTAGDKIVNIGKTLAAYNAFDTGIFRANASLFSAIRQSEQGSGDCSISGGMKILAQDGRAIAVDVGSARWIDVDSPQMLRRADDWRLETQADEASLVRECAYSKMQ